MGSTSVSRERMQQPLQLLAARWCLAKPCGMVDRIEDHRHAVVNRRAQGVGLAGDDGEPAHRLTGSEVPEPGEREGRAIGHDDAVRLRSLGAYLLPFVE